jgi:hypothetical protein
MKKDMYVKHSVLWKRYFYIVTHPKLIHRLICDAKGMSQRLYDIEEEHGIPSADNLMWNGYFNNTMRKLWSQQVLFSSYEVKSVWRSLWKRYKIWCYIK